MSEGSSYRQILRSSSIIGGASVINILFSLVRTKVAAVLLGPAGVGLIGLFTNVVATASTVSGLGFGNVGTRQVAEAVGQGDPQRIAAARRALYWGTLVLAIAGAGFFWSLREVLAIRVLGDATLARELGWLAIAVALTVASASQYALLNGLRRIGDIARLSIGTALLSTVAGVLALWWMGRAGIVIYVIAVPVASFALGHWYVARLPRIDSAPTTMAALSVQWRVLTRLGVAFMVAGLAGTAGQLLVRTLVQRELGVDALGQFQAAWAISMTYIGFVLTAMGTDYYPRLTAVIEDHAAVNRMVNEQTEVALLLATPVLLAMLGLAPWVIELLYSDAFAEAANVLRWQVLGDLLKVASWPLGFILLASGAGKTYMLSEWAAMALFVLFTAWLLPRFGVSATGLSFLAMYAGYLPLVYWLAVRKTGFRYSITVLKLLGAGFAAGVCLIFIAGQSLWIGSALGVLLASAFGVHGLVRLAHMADIGGPMGKLSAAARGYFYRIGVWRD